jgi:hypothetical protein
LVGCECVVKMTEIQSIKDGAKSRKERIQRLEHIIANTPNKSEATIIGIFGRESGLTVTKIREYINELENWGIIQRRNGYLVYAGCEGNVD